MCPQSNNAETTEAACGPVDEVAAALAAHHGDVCQTVRSLLSREQALLEKLAFAEGCMSKGFTRGWKPSKAEERCATPEA